MKILPSVTIGIPVYNEEKFVAETIFSAINQSYHNLKIVISDNCSTDNTFEEIKKVIANHDNVSVIRQEKNIGLPSNFNYLSQNANTDFFCWLSGHDLLHRDFIAAAVRVFLENPGLSLVYPKSEQIDEKGKFRNIEAHDRIDTTTLDFVQGPLKVARTVDHGTPIHGLWNTSILKEYKYKPFAGSDLNLLYHASISGKIFELPDVYHFLRIVREETPAEGYKRNSEFGLQAKYANPNTEMCEEYLRYTLFSKKVKLVPKIKLLRELTAILEMKYNYVHLITRLFSIKERIKYKIEHKFRRSRSTTGH